MKLLIDMNLSPRWAITFPSATSADHWSTIGRHDATDAEIMAYAREHGYVVVTSDLDFSAMLAASGAEGPSVVQIRADNLDPSVIGRDVLVALIEVEDQLERGALVSIAPGRPTRVRVLPLQND